jgi:hypothetical protein
MEDGGRRTEDGGRRMTVTEGTLLAVTVYPATFQVCPNPILHPQSSILDPLSP